MKAEVGGLRYARNGGTVRMILENIPMKKISYISVRALAVFFRLRLKK